jgi:LuxR family maltose regulon positive regulatory protein
LANAFELAANSGLPRSLMNAQLLWVRVLITEGNWAGAHQAMERVNQLVTEYKLPLFFQGRADACQVRLWLAEGDMNAASDWARTSGMSIHDELGPLMEILHLTFVRVLIAEGRWDQSAEFLARLEQAAQEAGRIASVIEILALDAVALHGRGDDVSARRTLERSLTLAEPEGYVRMFVDEGEAMRLLIADLRSTIQKRTLNEETKRMIAYTGKLLGAFPASPSATQPPLEEILSEREVEVLRLLAIGASNQEIADKLVVALNTVKRHVSHIFDKLEVSNRTQAVAKARDLGLL